MNDWTRTLRGCATAYGAGVAVIGTVNAISARDLDVIFIVALFGLIAALPFAVIALLLTAVLRARRTRITALQGIGITSVTFGFWGAIGGMLDGAFASAAVIGLSGALLGVGFGAAFWIGAYGWTQEYQFGAPEEAP